MLSAADFCPEGGGSVVF